MIPSRIRILAPALALLFAPTSVAAQWTRVTALPVDDVFSVWANGDTIVAGVDTATCVSTNGGATWKLSKRVVAGATAIESARIRNGRLYAGTFGQGVFVSDDLGDTWIPYSQGLVGGIANAQLFIQALLIRGDSLYAATSGAGAWVRNLSGPGSWTHFGNAFEPNQASNMSGIAAGGSRLFAAAGGNGTVFFRDPGDADWTRSWLDNVGAVPGLGALTAAWTGAGWVVGSNIGVFTSPLGEEPWTFRDVGLGTLFNVSFAQRGRDVFACFGTRSSSTFAASFDDGASWHEFDVQPFIFTYALARQGTDLYAARFDGLWRFPIATVSVPSPPAAGGLRFAVAGAQPVRGDVRFRFDLSAPGPAAIDVFDVSGRRVGGRVAGAWPAGSHGVSWAARGLAPGVYVARLSVGAETAVVRFVRVP